VNPIDFNKSNVDINYTVYVPETVELEITNKFGDLNITDCSGRLTTSIEHGDIRISGILQRGDISLRYGQLRVRELPEGTISVKNGGIDIETSNDLKLNSSGSSIELGTVPMLRLESNKDQIAIENTNSMMGSIRFSDVVVQQLGNKIDLNLHLGDLTIEHISSSNPSLIIEQSASDISIQAGVSSFMVSASLEGGVLRLPKQIEDLDVQVLDEKKQLRKIKATYGKAPFGELDINGKKGLVQIKQN